MGWLRSSWRFLAAITRAHGIRLHCDGARLFNAAVATGAAPADFARHCDTVCFCLSKGLGAPAGSVLAGDEATLEEAHRYRKLLGGGMRQAGVLAAAGLHALEHHVADLAEDHRRARGFRDALEARGVAFPLPSPTNIVYIAVPGAPAAAAALAEAGVRVFATGPDRLRAVFHRDISDEDAAGAAEVFSRVLLG